MSRPTLAEIRERAEGTRLLHDLLLPPLAALCDDRAALLHEIDALLAYLRGDGDGCTHEGIGLPGCSTCEGRWSREVRAVAQAHAGRAGRIRRAIEETDLDLAVELFGGDK